MMRKRLPVDDQAQYFMVLTALQRIGALDFDVWQDYQYRLWVHSWEGQA